MADNRIYMQCNICGKKLYLGKQFGWGAFYWYNYGDERPFEDCLNEFFEKHNHPEADVCKWNGNFSIVYEMDDNPGLGFDDVWKPYQFKRGKDCKGCHGIKGFCEEDNT